MGRPPKNVSDERGKVRIVVHLVGTRHRPIKGNRMRTIIVYEVRVTDVAAIIEKAVGSYRRGSNRDES